MKRLIPCLLLAMTLPLAAQLSVNAKDLKGRTILISSDAGDVELKKGIATFYGNVIVNDPEVLITCQKMVLYQEPKAQRKDKKSKPDASDKKDSKKSQKDDDVKLERIECIGDVVIVRKNTGESSQRGTCGKAVYYHKEGKINMLDEPVVYQNDSVVTGTRLTLFCDSERIEGTKINIVAKNLDQERERSKKGKKKTNSSGKQTDADAVDDFYNNDKDSEGTQASQKNTAPKTSKDANAILGLDPEKKK